MGYARAGRIIDQMEEREIISPYQGSKPREVLIDRKRCLEIDNNCIEDNEEMKDKDIELEGDAIEDSSIEETDEVEENEENVYENILRNKWFWIWIVIIVGIIAGMIG